MDLFERLHTQITWKQHCILIHLYRFRFLNRIHIQTLMRHKDYKRINIWLKDLAAKGYIERIYTTSMPENTKPAVYYLGKYARRVLHQAEPSSLIDFEEVGANYTIEKEDLRRLYKDGTLKEAFRADCLAIADCYMAIDKSIDRTNKRLFVTTHTEINHHETINTLKPDLSFYLTPTTIDYEPGEEEGYYVYYISNRKQRKYLAYRIAHVMNILSTDDFLANEFTYAKYSMLFIAASIPLRNYVMGIVKRKLKNMTEIPKITFKFTTLEEFKKHGFYNTPWKVIDAENEEYQ